MSEKTPQSPKTSKPARKNISFILLTVLILIGLIGLSIYFSKKQDVEKPKTDHGIIMKTDDTVIVKGVVVENVKDCVTDLDCYLVVKADKEEVNVIYSPTRGTPCLNTKPGDEGIELKKGDEVEVFGKFTGSAKIWISTCDSKDYYIRTLP